MSREIEQIRKISSADTLNTNYLTGLSKLHSALPSLRSKGDLSDIFEIVRVFASFRLIWRRIKIYIFIVGIVYLAHYATPSEGYQTANLEDWGSFLAITAGFQIVAAAVEAILFSIISAFDYCLVGRFWAPLFYADCFDGPLGGMIWVSLSFLFLKQHVVVKEVLSSDWNNLHISGIVIFFSYGVLNVFQRKSYGSLLLKKYTEKINELDQYKKLLTSVINGTLRRNGSAHLESTHVAGEVLAYAKLPWPKDAGIEMKARDAPPKETGMDDDIKDDENEEDDDEDDKNLHEQRVFWRKLRRYSSGIVKLQTIKGSMFISSTSQAKKIGKRLHRELVKIDKKSTEVSEVKLRSEPSDVTDDDEALLKGESDGNRGSIKETHYVTFWDDFIHSLHKDSMESGSDHLIKDVPTSLIKTMIYEWNGYYDDNAVINENIPLPSPTMARSEVDQLVRQAMMILDPTSTNKISKTVLQSSLVKIYHDIKFFAGSIQEFSSLHSSLESITNGVFWFIMAIVFLVIMGVDVFELFIPIGTVLIAISFAVGDAVKNAIISVWYVLFILPYDIGDRVILNGDHSSHSAMYVRNISLMKTTFCNVSNETIIYPNHLLFSLPLTNHKLSPGAILEIKVDLAISSSASLIKEFIDRMQAYAQERPHIWAVIDVYVYSIDVMQGTVATGIWATHRFSWQDFGKILANKNDLMLFVKNWLDMKGIRFEIPMQRIGLSINDDPVRSILPSHSFSKLPLTSDSVRAALDSAK